LVIDRTNRFSRRWYEFTFYRLCGNWNVFGFGLHAWGCPRPCHPTGEQRIRTRWDRLKWWLGSLPGFDASMCSDDSVYLFWKGL
jgi:hypothetical protein